jgi:hypothetical protein
MKEWKSKVFRYNIKSPWNKVMLTFGMNMGEDKLRPYAPSLLSTLNIINEPF